MAEKASKFYRSTISALSVIVRDADPAKGEVQPETVRFSPFEERWDGDKIKVGYLSTDNSVAQRKLADDPNVEEITEEEFARATDPDVNEKVKPLPLQDLNVTIRFS